MMNVSSTNCYKDAMINTICMDNGDFIILISFTLLMQL